MFAQVLLTISALVAVAAGMMAFADWGYAQSAPQQAVICALGLLVAAIPYFIARAIATAQIIAHLSAIRDALEAARPPVVRDVAEG